jgi:DNA-binding HxlR family transcriptional regulator
VLADYTGGVISRPLCRQFHQAVELIGRRWNGAIVFVLQPGPARFCELRASIPGITDRMLTERLQELEGEGLLVRTVIPETPVRVEYALTKKGRSLGEAIETITAWGHKWLSASPSEPAEPARAARRRRA